MDCEKALELTGIWFSGFATWAAVIAALGLPRLYRPRLEAICDPDSFACSTYISGPALGAGIEEYWVKLGIFNNSDYLADDVQARVILVACDALSARPSYNSFSSWWLKLSGMDATSISVPPRFTQFVDLCFVHREPVMAGSPLRLAAVRQSMQGWDIEHKKIIQSVRLTLATDCVNSIIVSISGKNTSAAYYRIDLKYAPKSETLSQGESAIRAALRVSKPRIISGNIQALFVRANAERAGT